MPNTAYKRFIGPNAYILGEKQLVGYNLARQSEAWKSNILPISSGPFGSIRSSRALPLTTEDIAATEAWVFRVTGEAIEAGKTTSAAQLINLESLYQFLSTTEGLANRLFETLSSFHLPGGATHGDLHRKNIMKIDNKLVAIDLDRFSMLGTPLFDRLHYQLSEAKRSVPKGEDRRWENLLANRIDIVTQVAADYALPEQLKLAYACHRVLLEGSTVLIRGELDEYISKKAVYLERFVCELETE